MKTDVGQGEDDAEEVEIWVEVSGSRGDEEEYQGDRPSRKRMEEVGCARLPTVNSRVMLDGESAATSSRRWETDSAHAGKDCPHRSEASSDHWEADRMGQDEQLRWSWRWRLDTDSTVVCYTIHLLILLLSVCVMVRGRGTGV